MLASGSATEPLWYKDAIIYEVHVKAFCDSNNDGIGDFGGLIQKLDYLQDLGITCIWLLPFFPSPLRDDGYDIADYTSVHPSYGTMDDFRAFLDAAHERGLRVMIELVMNHTSDEHPWFKAARNAPPGSAERDYYVWSDSDQKYDGVRIIFTDTEKSNWMWDPIAKAYFWHRFFSHQPDLNFDNPAVVEEMLKVMRFWLGMGVDGLRLDAIPYLIERDGTNCENLAETHVLIKKVRGEMDRLFPNRMILAEANQWPTDVRPYFGDGDECHMAFHFPLMPRIFMALRLEDRLPITEIMSQTPAIPENCQWGLFLRNHDELTLEMVSDEERDYMYMAYSADPRMRINIGIRRRLAPLMDNSRRRIELLNSLLFSFPGTPIIYYGDEIGMGDNIYLGDRNGVRTPMQWSPDRNAGFSRATPARLYTPVIMDPVYGFEAINVEAQQGDASSLLNWMRNMIALRKLFRVFGRGTLEFLKPSNQKVLAYLRCYEGEHVLCVANLSRFAQPVELDLSPLAGLRPVEMLGYVDFPPIGRRPYTLTLGPYGFLWFELHKPAEPVEIRPGEAEAEVAVYDVSDGWHAVFTGAGLREIESRGLPDYLPRQRWFGGKARRIQSATVADWGELDGSESAIALVDVRYENQSSETYFVPLAMSFGHVAEELRSSAPHSIVASITSKRNGDGMLHDAVFDAAACSALLSCIENRCDLRTRNGAIQGVVGSGLIAARGPDEGSLPPIRAAVEQSNTSILFGDSLIMKLFRRQEPGPNPDCEINAFLSERTAFGQLPPFAGSLEYRREGGEASTLAMLQGMVRNEGDGWKWTLEELDRYYEYCARIPFPGGDESPLTESQVQELAREHLGIYLGSATVLGRRAGEMHLALASDTQDPAFAPEPLAPDDLRALAAEFRENAAHVFDALKENLAKLPDEVVEQAGLALSRRRRYSERFSGLAKLDMVAQRTRIHGDFHLGQTLRVKNDYVILDFEGEPARSLAERRAKHSPLKDVAGMLRSFSYAAFAALLNYNTRRPEYFKTLEPWARLWEQATAAEFLREYRQVTETAAFLPQDDHAFQTLLDAYLLDKALYELRYELDNRPNWVRIPLWGILSL